MNIFILDEHIPTNVSYYIDKWVVKMPLETAQILCTVRHMYNLPPHINQHTENILVFNGHMNQNLILNIFVN